jgi:hypothetical protein
VRKSGTHRVVLRGFKPMTGRSLMMRIYRSLIPTMNGSPRDPMRTCRILAVA